MRYKRKFVRPNGMTERDKRLYWLLTYIFLNGPQWRYDVQFICAYATANDIPITLHNDGVISCERMFKDISVLLYRKKLVVTAFRTHWLGVRDEQYRSTEK